MLLWPLHITSFSLWDRLVMHDYYGAKQVLVISASSKTSLGLGFALKEDKNAPKSIGLTSKGNKAWVESVDLYHDVLSYQQVKQLDANATTVIVDMSGNAGLINQLQKHLRDNLKFCLSVGLTHWGEMNTQINISKAKDSDAQEYIKVEIQKSLSNVSLLRAPITLNIKDTNRRHGLFLPLSSKLNNQLGENIILTCSSSYSKILLKIKAGVCSRKIDLFKSVGPLKSAQRFGLLIDGGVELFVALDTRIKVSIGDSVKAGESVLGYFAIQEK
jgi:phosphatidylserine decarboxylase